MLVTLSIRDIVLIDQLTLTFGAGLNVLTGETGAGKSILLDALGLALGKRADADLIRAGEAQGSVTAEFAIDLAGPVAALLGEQGLPAAEERLLIRRVITTDRKSRAFINDEPVGVGLLAEVAALLVELHGQNDDAGLLSAGGHRMLLDQYGALDAELAAVAQAHAHLADCRARLAEAEATLATARADAEFLSHALAELDALTPAADEEETLAQTRATMMAAEQIADDIQAALALLTGSGGSDEGVEGRFAGAARRISACLPKASGALDPVAAALERASIEAAEAVAAVERAARAVEYDPAKLDQAEERLFALRAAARKHNVTVDQLPAVHETLRERLAAIDQGEEGLAALHTAVAEAEATYDEAATALTAGRRAVSLRLEDAVAAELEPLKLGKATFKALVSPLENGEATGSGRDRVEFLISTNPGSPLGALTKIASGGELSRIVLALKVVLARTRSAPVMIFDEVDRGIGGATADVVGERLRRLSRDSQLLVITHSPQVAAKGDHHFRIQKAVPGVAVGARTSVDQLDEAARREEIARMLAGATVTDAARNAADDLMRAVS